MATRLRYRWHPCKHCHYFLEKHGDMQCLFQPTTFEGMNHEEYLRAIYADDGDPVLEATQRYAEYWKRLEKAKTSSADERHRAVVNLMLEHCGVNKKRPMSMRNALGGINGDDDTA